MIIFVFVLLYASISFQAPLPGYVGLAAYVGVILSQII